MTSSEDEDEDQTEKKSDVVSVILEKKQGMKCVRFESDDDEDNMQVIIYNYF